MKTCRGAPRVDRRHAAAGGTVLRHLPGGRLAVGQGLFSGNANGSLVRWADVVGSSLLAQGFAGPSISTPPSAAGRGTTRSIPGDEPGATSKKLIGDVMQRVADYRAETSCPDVRVPADAVTSSASGLTPTSALRTRRIRRAGSPRRGLTKEEVLKRVRAHAEGRTLGILGSRGERADAESGPGRNL